MYRPALVAIVIVCTATIAQASYLIKGFRTCLGNPNAKIQVRANTDILSKNQLLRILNLTAQGNIVQYQPPLLAGSVLTMYFKPESSSAPNNNTAVMTTLSPVMYPRGVAIACSVRDAWYVQYEF